MTNRELLEKMILEMTDSELAEFICHNDFRNMATLDNETEGRTPKEKIEAYLKKEANVYCLE